MKEGNEFRELMIQIFRTRMAFRRAMQRTLKDNNAGITFEMLQVLSSLWHEQGITQQALAERTAKDKACLTNLMNRRDMSTGKRIRMTDATSWCTSLLKGKHLKSRFARFLIWYTPTQKKYCLPNERQRYYLN